MTWKKKHLKERETPKYVKAGTRLTFNPLGREPEEVEVEGNYGKRRMFIVECEELGLVYVSPTQFIKISEALAAFEFANTTTLEV